MIRDTIEAVGYPPTRAEIARQLGFRSANAAEDHLRALARKGVIELVEAGRLPRHPPGDRGELGMPLIGRVAAGQPDPRRGPYRGAATRSTPACSSRAPTTCSRCAA
ncbi:MAG: hypothetical protein MZW92_25235 [Comamonadaceae bacterium]|nr:hypothetical protein [Comamonadaceae bacterium]